MATKTRRLRSRRDVMEPECGGTNHYKIQHCKIFKLYLFYLEMGDWPTQGENWQILIVLVKFATNSLLLLRNKYAAFTMKYLFVKN